MPRRKPCPCCGFGLAPVGYVEIYEWKMYSCVRCGKTFVYTKGGKLHSTMTNGRS